MDRDGWLTELLAIWIMGHSYTHHMIYSKYHMPAQTYSFVECTLKYAHYGTNKIFLFGYLYVYACVWSMYSAQ